MTSCTFQKCQFSSGLQLIKSRATTYSHICFSDSYQGYSDLLDGIFLKTDTPVDSFLKIFYSTIVGDNKESKALSIIYLLGQCSFQYQCMNLSNYKLQYRDSSFVAGVKVISQKCLNMQMNTFYKLDIRYSLFINPQDGNVGYGHYVGLCNFFDNNFENVIDVDMNQNTKACIDGCIFKNSNERNKANIFHFDRKPTNCIFRIENCVFEVDYIIVGDPPTLETSNNKVIQVPTSLNLAHFIVPDICAGVVNNNAFGCKNGKCPEERGCDANAFNFKPDDITYTELFHPDIDTPTPKPTFYFSFSLAFSESVEFTRSNEFARSNEFTQSDDHIRSEFFTKSDYFSMSNKFSKCSPFSKSNQFTLSNELDKPDVVDRDESNSGNKLKPGEIAGIAVAAAAAAVIVALVLFIVIKKYRMKLPDDEDIETISSNTASTTNNNPIYNANGEDDPFKEDFNS